MALLTLGTNGTTTLSALQYKPGVGGNGGMSAADFAALNALILPQGSAPTLGYKYEFRLGSEGELFLPGKKGVIRLAAGDYIGVDANGWPIVVSSQSIASGSTSWTHS